MTLVGLLALGGAFEVAEGEQAAVLSSALVALLVTAAAEAPRCRSGRSREPTRSVFLLTITSSYGSQVTAVPPLVWLIEPQLATFLVTSWKLPVVTGRDAGGRGNPGRAVTVSCAWISMAREPPPTGT